MTTKKSIRRKTLPTLIALVLVCALFVGSTYAWFTDTASSGKNRIIAGELYIDLLLDKNAIGTYTGTPDTAYAPNYESIKDGFGDIFTLSDTTDSALNSNDTLWEPGKTQVVYLAVRNIGDLALKYNIWLNISDVDDCVSMVQNGFSALEYAIIDDVRSDDADYGYTQLSSLSWAEIKAVAVQSGDAQTGDIILGQQKTAENGRLDEIVRGIEDETDYFALVIHMKEEAGNDFQMAAVNIDVTVVAGQTDAEGDSFNNQYDVNAPYTK